jgi:hypothetical protein
MVPQLEAQLADPTNGLGAQVSSGIAAQLPPAYAPYASAVAGIVAPPINSAMNGVVSNALNSIPTDQYGNQLLYAKMNSTARMNYLMLPILAKFGWDFGHQKQWRFYVDAGPYVALLVSAHQLITNAGNLTLGTIYTDPKGTTSISNLIGGTVGGAVGNALTGLAQNNTMFSAILAQYPDLNTSFQQVSGQVSGQVSDQISSVPSPLNTTQDIKYQLHSFNWGFEGNLGFQYQIKRNKIFIEGGGNYGMMNIQKSTGKTANGAVAYANGKNHIGAGTVMVGYAYAL